MLEKQPQGLFCSKWKLHEYCITFTSSLEYLKAYSVLFCQILGHLGKKTHLGYTEKTKASILRAMHVVMCSPRFSPLRMMWTEMKYVSQRILICRF